ncbi:hypothetical protein [Treponema phagedenis]|uniref:hypothetical protein n=1 Tax=Treponema phagedenis TaxID=162 RepID=UPI0015825649|nr:hypothetical protein [Treponema phagedenis]QKS91118.1 hypothetical protein HPJ96_05855 [Treponema phagedenis]
MKVKKKDEPSKEASMVSLPTLLNSERCFKASTQNCKIEALKLVGEAAANY